MSRRSSRRNKLQEDEYYVEDIISRKLDGDRYLYEVKWEGYPHSENTWIREEDFTDRDFVRRFNQTCDEAERKANTSRKKRLSSMEKVSNDQKKDCNASLANDCSNSGQASGFCPKEDSVNLSNIDSCINSSKSLKYRKNESALDAALRNGQKVKKLTSPEIKVVISKFTGLGDVRYLLETVGGNLLIVRKNQLVIDKILDKQLKEADSRHEGSLKVFSSK
uniref:Chromo domain-containing protein n=1 Tax=Strongyloides papillosus TaxID=174720 RepID=A0A0N5B8L0_STREA